MVRPRTGPRLASQFDDLVTDHRNGMIRVRRFVDLYDSAGNRVSNPADVAAALVVDRTPQCPLRLPSIEAVTAIGIDRLFQHRKLVSFAFGTGRRGIHPYGLAIGGFFRGQSGFIVLSRCGREKYLACDPICTQGFATCSTTTVGVHENASLRITLDLPDPIFWQLKAASAFRGLKLKELMAEAGTVKE